MDPGLSNDARSQLVQQLQSANDTTDAQIRDFFDNDAAYVYYQTYVQQEPERMEVGSLTESLDGANLPLDPTQADTLRNAPISNSPRTSTTRPKSPPNPSPAPPPTSFSRNRSNSKARSPTAPPPSFLPTK
jgi:hypothetical protein